jgi:hypothetical protein
MPDFIDFSGQILYPVRTQKRVKKKLRGMLRGMQVFQKSISNAK